MFWKLAKYQIPFRSIFSFLDLSEHAAVRSTSRQISLVAQDPAFWPAILDLSLPMLMQVPAGCPAVNDSYLKLFSLHFPDPEEFYAPMEKLHTCQRDLCFNIRSVRELILTNCWDPHLWLHSIDRLSKLESITLTTSEHGLLQISERKIPWPASLHTFNIQTTVFQEQGQPPLLLPLSFLQHPPMQALMLDDVRVAPKELDKLAQICSALQTLMICDWHFPLSGPLPAGHHLRALHSLYLQAVFFEEADQMMPLLHLAQLQHLSFVNCGCHQVDAKEVMPVVAAMLDQTPLEHLFLSRSFANSLDELPSLQGLKHLVLEDYDYLSSPQLHSSLWNCTSLQTLTLHKCPQLDSGAWFLLASLSNLQRLDIQKCPHLGSSEADIADKWALVCNNQELLLSLYA